MCKADKQATIALYESEKFKQDDKIRTLEEKLAKVREERDQAQELASQRPPSPSSRARAAVSAAEIDNETLNAQVKHLQNKVNNLEEELDERRAELESEAESWKQKVQQVRDAEKIQVELVKSLRGEIGDYKTQTNSAKNRIGELEGALKETQAALEGARAEIETLRVEAAVSLLTTKSVFMLIPYRKLHLCDPLCKLLPPMRSRMQTGKLRSQISSRDSQSWMPTRIEAESWKTRSPAWKPRSSQ